MATNSDTTLTENEANEFEQELKRVRDKASSEKRHHERWRFFWTAVYYTFGISAVVVTALAGVSGIAKDNAELAGWLAAVGAVLMAVVTFFGADKKRAAHEQQVVAYDGLLVADCDKVESYLTLRTLTGNVTFEHDVTFEQLDQLREKLRDIGNKDQPLGIA